MRYKYKHDTVEAVRHYDDPEKFEKVNHHFPSWVIEAVRTGVIIAEDKDSHLVLECAGKKYNIRIRDGDWLVRMHNKEIITMDDKTFTELFETKKTSKAFTFPEDLYSDNEKKLME